MLLPVLPGDQSVHGTHPAVRTQDAAEDFDSGALPRPVGADVAQNLSVRDGEGHVPQSGDLGVVAGEDAFQRVSQSGLPTPDPVGF